MPAAVPQQEHPIASFARELDALLKRYEDLVEPADLAVTLNTNVAAIVASYGDPKAFAAMQAYYGHEAKLKMAKARLES